MTVKFLILSLVLSIHFHDISAQIVSTYAGTGSAGNTNGPAATATFRNPYGIAVDNQGNVYVAEFGNDIIRKITPEGEVSTLAGSGTEGSVDGQGTGASFNAPSGVAVDKDGNVFVADYSNNKIRKITQEGMVSTYAGNGSSGGTDGDLSTATFETPNGVTFDSKGNLYVVEYYGYRIRKITPEGQVSTIAGLPAVDAEFDRPTNVAVDASDNLFITDQYNHVIKKLSSEGEISIFAGTGEKGSTDGDLATATFDYPTDLCFDTNGNLFVLDQGSSKVRIISPEGIVTTYAGTGTNGFNDGDAHNAKFYGPIGITIDASNNLYIADNLNQRIRMIKPEKVTGIKSKKNDLFSIHPNPATDYIIIKNNTIFSLYSIVAADGTIVQTGVIQNGNIDIKNLLPGYYLIKVDSSLIRFIKE